MLGGGGSAAVAYHRQHSLNKNANNNIPVHHHPPNQSQGAAAEDQAAAEGDAAAGAIVVTANPMSASVPNLTTSQEAAQHAIEAVTPPGFLETFAAMAKRRTSQGTGGGGGFQANSSVIGGGGGGGGVGSGGGGAGNTNNSNSGGGTGFFPRGPNSVTSLVKLALSSNFHTGFLSTAQSYPSLSSANNGAAPTSNPAQAHHPPNGGANSALTMSLTSTASSDSEQVSLEDFLESCRAPQLLADLEDDEDMEDENDDDENEDEYQEFGSTLLQVMVSRNLLSVMDEESLESRLVAAGKRKSWDDEYVLKQQFSALIPAFDPRPGRTNVNQTTDLEIPAPGGQSEEDADDVEEEPAGAEVHVTPQPALSLILKGPNLAGVADVEIPLNDAEMTIFGAVQELMQLTALSKNDKIKKIWEPTYTIIYREAGTKEENSSDEGRTTPVVSILSSGRSGGSTLSPSSPLPMTPSSHMQCSVDDVLQLLSQLNSITNHHGAAAAASDPNQSLNDTQLAEAHSADIFMSKKITNKLLQQIQDPLVLSSNSLPGWCEQLNQACPFLFPFDTRQLYFSSTAFGASRSIVWLQTQRDTTLDRRMPGSSPRRDDQHEFRVGRLKHDRVKVPRNESLLEWAMQVMKIHAHRKSVLEVEFIGEEGTGLGPTLEFYALVAAELQRSDLGMWLYEDEHAEEGEDESEGRRPAAEEEVDLGKGAKPHEYYVRRPSGLFPAPLPQDSEICERVAKYFEFLGIFLAKVLQDGRIVDLPLSNSFLQLLCHNKNLTKGGRAPHAATAGHTVPRAEDIMISSIMSEESDREPESLAGAYGKYVADACPERSWYDGILGAEQLREIDPHRADFLRDLQDVVARKVAIEQEAVGGEEEKRRQVEALRLVTKGGHEVAIEDLALTFSFAPSSKVYGFEAVELVPGGHDVDVTVDTVEEYCEQMTTFCLQDGIARQLQAFHRGFCQVFPLNKLAAFSPEEARIMICGEQNPEWTREDLLSYTEPKLGYTKDSPGFLRLVNVLMSLTGPERKAFLQFTTGCSSLPPGGLANLAPRLTVVRKVDAGEGSYPSVNTCVHYLKMPDYPTEEILKERLLTATKEKGFHLN